MESKHLNEIENVINSLEPTNIIEILMMDFEGWHVVNKLFIFGKVGDKMFACDGKHNKVSNLYDFLMAINEPFEVKVYSLRYNSIDNVNYAYDNYKSLIEADNIDFDEMYACEDDEDECFDLSNYSTELEECLGGLIEARKEKLSVNAEFNLQTQVFQNEIRIKIFY